MDRTSIKKQAVRLQKKLRVKTLTPGSLMQAANRVLSKQDKKVSTKLKVASLM